MHPQHSLTSASVFMFDSHEQYTNIRYTWKEEKERKRGKRRRLGIFRQLFFPTIHTQNV